MGKVKKITLKIEIIIFTITWLILKIYDYQNIYSVSPLHFIVTNARGYIEEEDLNTLYLNIVLDYTDEIKSYWKNIVMFEMELNQRGRWQWVWLWKRLHGN